MTSNSLCIVMFLFFMGVIGFLSYQEVVFTNSIVRFEQRCTSKGGLTLRAYKTGNEWIGCYKDNIELENEE